MVSRNKRKCPAGSTLEGFTLIELLIVVAIIAILAAIALPNFLEAQTRTKVSRARADHRTLATALEAYYIDQNAYPSANNNGSVKWLRWMTTPIAYTARADIDDPFTGKDRITDSKDSNLSYATYRFYALNEMGYLNAYTASGTLFSEYKPAGTLKVLYYLLYSHGPDKVRSKASNGKTFIDGDNLFNPTRFIELIYDPSNGTVSNGEIFRTGGERVGRAAPAIRMVQ